jgi:hypothetical protein
MPEKCYNLKSSLFSLLLLMFFLGQVSCKYKARDLHKVTFKPVWSIKYTEVKRRHINGRSFDKYGYKVDPSWLVTFLSDDSARIYSPQKGAFVNFVITNDHDSIFHMAHTWFRAKKLTKDSLVLQVMLVKSKVIYVSRSSVYMTLYSDDYIKNTLKTTPASLQQTDRADTLFVRSMIAHPHKDPDSLFAAHEPVVLKSKSPLVTISKTEVTATEFNNYNTAAAYLYPEYTIKIKNAYKDFDYSFTAVVNEKGQMRLGKSLMVSFEDNTNILKGIIDGYLKAYLNVKPGTTMGIPHASRIYINVEGRK